MALSKASFRYGEFLMWMLPNLWLAPFPPRTDILFSALTGFYTGKSKMTIGYFMISHFEKGIIANRLDEAIIKSSALFDKIMLFTPIRRL
jgi:hypothetical protein